MKREKKEEQETKERCETRLYSISQSDRENSLTVLPYPACMRSDSGSARWAGRPAAAAPGDDYKVCWAHAPSAVGDYIVKLGEDGVIAGPVVPAAFACSLGETCSLQLSGYGLDVADYIDILDGS